MAKIYYEAVMDSKRTVESVPSFGVPPCRK